MPAGRIYIQNMKHPLTLIVPLLDRHELTDRSLLALQKQRCEYKIIVADGSSIPFSGSYDLDIEYFYNGFDTDISQYMNKMHKATQMVKTPLSMVFDNDDIIDLKGIRNGISFLSKNEEYSTYQNDVRPIQIEPEIKLEESLYTKKSIEQDSPQDRLFDVIENFNSFNYAIFRSNIVKCFFEILDSLQNDDFQLFQKGWAYVAAIFGKCKRLQNDSYYYFIPGNSILQTGGKIHKFSSWVDTRYWKSSCPQIISIIGNLYENIYEQDIREYFCRNFMNEICKKNNLHLVGEDYIDMAVSTSYSYDDKIQETISRHSFKSEKFDYEISCEAKHDRFIKEIINA